VNHGIQPNCNHERIRLQSVMTWLF